MLNLLTTWAIALSSQATANRPSLSVLSQRWQLLRLAGVLYQDQDPQVGVQKSTSWKSGLRCPPGDHHILGKVVMDSHGEGLNRAQFHNGYC